MTIELKPDQERMINSVVRSGAYRHADEVLDQAFAIIRQQLEAEDWMLHQREEVRDHIALGFAQAQNAELVEGDSVLEILRDRREKRIARER